MKDADPLIYNIKRMYAKLTAAELIVLRNQLSILKTWLDDTSDGYLNIASLLSGSEVQFFVWKMLSDIWRQKFGIEIPVVLRVSCEIQGYVRDWITEYASPDMVYKDVHDLRHQEIPVPEGGLAVCVFGIECDTVSGLNNGWQERLGCVSEDSGRTGSSAVSCLQFVIVNSIASWLGECVKHLGSKDPSNGRTPAECIIEEANKYGWIVWSHSVEGDEYGDPESRPRFYMYGHYVGKQESAKQQTDNWRFPENIMKLAHFLIVLRIETAPLDLYLLPETHPTITCLRTSISAFTINSEPPKPAKPQKRQKKNVNQDTEVALDEPDKIESYEIDHLEAFESKGMQWPPQLPATFLQKMVGQFASSRRMQELIWFDESVNGSADSIKEGLVVRDANLSKSWGCAKSGSIPCIAQSSVMYVRGVKQYCLRGNRGVCHAKSAQEIVSCISAHRLLSVSYTFLRSILDYF